MLQDQHDFLVVGVLGTQGVGKSTVMSALAGDDLAKYVVVLLQRKITITKYGWDLLIQKIELWCIVLLHVLEVEISVLISFLKFSLSSHPYLPIDNI